MCHNGSFRSQACPTLLTSDPFQGPTASPAAPDPYAAWRNRDYRRYAVGWFLLTVAKMIETVAIQVYVHQRTGSALALGLIGLAQALPMMLWAIPGGQIADRWDRRRVMVAMLGLSTLVSAGLTMAVSRDVAVEWIYVLLFAGASSAALGTPSRAAQLHAPRALVVVVCRLFSLAAIFGPAASVVLGGVGTILVVIGAARVWPQILGIGSLQDIRPADAAQAELDADGQRALEA